MSLKKQALSGMVWTFSQQFGTQLISFAVGIILARLLLPSDFGTIALFSVVMAIGGSLVEGGMSSSLIRSNDVDQKDFSTIFWFNLIVSILIYWVIFFLAPLITQFFKIEILTTIIRVSSITIIINAFATVQSTRLVKGMDFKTLFKIRLPSLIVGSIIGVLMAWKGYGVWALVFYPIVQSVMSAVQLWLYSKWRPSFIFDKEKFKYHFQFGYKMTLSGLLDVLFKNVYTIIIGKLFSPVQLGYYNRADSLKQLPVSNLSTALNSVTFPLFSKMSNNNVKLKEVYQKLMKLVIFIIAPLLVLMIITAEPLIKFLLTDKWLPSAPFFQVLAIAGILYPIHAYNLNILKVKGRSDLFLKLEVWKKLLVVTVVLVSVRFGIIGIVWGQVCTSILAFFINTYYTGKILKYGSFQQIADLLPTLCLSAITGVLLYLADLYFFGEWQDLLRLIILTLLFAVIFLGAAWMLKFKEFNYIKELMKK